MENKESWREQLRRIGLELAPPGHEGIVYETRFEVTLESLKAKGKITSWEATEQYSEEDEKGIDYFVEVNNQTIPIQITSTKNKARGRKRSLRKRGRLIPVLYLVECSGSRKGELKPVQKVENEILRALTSYLRSTA